MKHENTVAILHHFKKNPHLWSDFDKNAAKIFQQIGLKQNPEEFKAWKTITEKLKKQGQKTNPYKNKQTYLLGM